MAQLHCDQVVVQTARKISHLFVIVLMIIVMIILMVIGIIIVIHAECAF